MTGRTRWENVGHEHQSVITNPLRRLDSRRVCKRYTHILRLRTIKGNTAE